MSRLTDRTNEWAKIGAATRLQQLEVERAAILKAFPELRRGTGRSGGGLGQRRQLSPAAKRKLSAGMRRYWARRKADAKAKAASK